jgi:hypothetical protein
MLAQIDPAECFYLASECARNADILYRRPISILQGVFYALDLVCIFSESIPTCLSSIRHPSTLPRSDDCASPLHLLHLLHLLGQPSGARIAHPSIHTLTSMDSFFPPARIP